MKNLDQIIKTERLFKKHAINMAKFGYFKKEDYQQFIKANHLYEMPQFEDICN